MTLKNLVIGITIMILTISVVMQGVSLFYKQPQYQDFCSDQESTPELSKNTPEACPTVCTEMYEIKNGECVYNSCGFGCGPNNVTSFETLKSCEASLEETNCWDEYDSLREAYSRNIFLISLPIGIAIIALGALVFGLESVGAGLMAGGGGVIFWGITNFWNFANDILKFVLLLVGLVAVIWLAYYFNEKFGKRKKKKSFKRKKKSRR